MATTQTFDVIIIGGSYAGLSAAMALGRSLRTTLVVDAGEPCNRQTPHSHNFLTQDGQPPAQIASISRAQVRAYDQVTLMEGKVVEAMRTALGFQVSLATGERFSSKKLILAMGIKDLLPQIPGFASCWGISAIHCPYCHGYEFRGKRTGIMASAEKALHLAPLVRNLTAHLSLFLDPHEPLTQDQQEALQRNGVETVLQPITSIIHEEGQLSQVVLQDGANIALDALYAQVPFEQASTIPQALGCTLTEQGYIQTDFAQRTNIPGVYACGDNSVPMRSVAQAVATGNMAGAMANMELSHQSF